MNQRDYRCRNMNMRSNGVFVACSRLLFRAYLPPGAHVSIRCPKCGTIVEIDAPLDNHIVSGNIAEKTLAK